MINTELERLYKEKKKLLRRIKQLKDKEKQERQEERQRWEQEKLNDPLEQERKRIRDERLKNPEYAKVVTLLKEAIAYEGTADAVGKKIGCSKTLVSLIRNGDYECGTSAFYTKLKKQYDFLENGTIMCLGNKSEMHIKVCKQFKEAVKNGRTLKNSVFMQVKDTCLHCNAGVRK